MGIIPNMISIFLNVNFSGDRVKIKAWPYIYDGLNQLEFIPHYQRFNGQDNKPFFKLLLDITGKTIANDAKERAPKKTEYKSYNCSKNPNLLSMEDLELRETKTILRYSKILIGVLLSIIALLIFIVAIGQKGGPDKDNQDWKIAKKTNTATAYKD